MTGAIGGPPLPTGPGEPYIARHRREPGTSPARVGTLRAWAVSLGVLAVVAVVLVAVL